MHVMPRILLPRRLQTRRPKKFSLCSRLFDYLGLYLGDATAEKKEKAQVASWRDA